jgi:hypothetical protein
MKYISPGGWFSLEYPDTWSEFEDSESTFLFYNPNKWCGNFRISAYKDAAKDYAEQCIAYELKQNPTSTEVRIGNWNCAYSAETFQEEGAWYTTHIWVTGKGDISFECSFTVAKGGERTQAEAIIRTLHIRNTNDFRKQEIIPIRIAEIGEINEAFDWMATTVKKQLNKDFTSQESDIVRIQKLIDEGKFKTDQRNTWEKIGLALGTILENEIDGIEWVTVIEGRKEYAALRYKQSSLLIKPAELVWERVKQQQVCNLSKEYECIKQSIEDLEN